MKGYILGSSQGSQEERALIDKVNRKGGVSRLKLRIHIDLGLFLSSIVWLFVAWTPRLQVLALAVSLAAGAWYFMRVYREYTPILRHGWVTTDNPELIALDREWRSAAEAETDPAWRLTIDQERFVQMRQLAMLSPSEARPLIQEEFRKLRTRSEPSSD